MGACSAGAHVKAGEPDVYYITSDDLDRWFGTWNLEWLAFRVFLGRGYDLAALAALNPNTPPERSWSDLIVSFLGGGRLGLSGGALAYGDELVAYHVFQEHCECNAATSYTTQALIHSWNTDGLFSQWSGWFGTSFMYTGSDAVAISAIRYHLFLDNPHPTRRLAIFDNTGAMLHDCGTVLGADDGGGWYKYTLPIPYALTANVEYFVCSYNPSVGIRLTNNAPPFGVANDCTWLHGIQRRDDTGVWEDVAGWTYSTWPFISGIAVAYTPTAAPSVDTTGQQTISAPTGTTSDDLAGMVYQLQVAVDTYGAQLEYLRQRVAPVEVTLGTAIPGLTGHGTLEDANAIGWVVDTTGLPSGYEQVGSEPPNIYNLGYLTLKGQGGWEQTYRLDHDPKLLLTPNSLVTALSYDLAAGVTATFTPLYGS